MPKHEYSFYLSFGVTVESDEKLDLEKPEDFLKLRALTIAHLEQEGVADIVKRPDFGDIDEE